MLNDINVNTISYIPPTSYRVEIGDLITVKSSVSLGPYNFHGFDGELFEVTVHYEKRGGILKGTTRREFLCASNEDFAKLYEIMYPEDDDEEDLTIYTSEFPDNLD